MPNLFKGILLAAWAVFLLLFIRNALRVSERRKSDPRGEAGRTVDRRANVGMLLEGLAVFFASVPRQSSESPPVIVLTAALALAALSILLAWLALSELGRHWRIQAVVTETHELVTTGPYGEIRHPVYTSLLGMVLATGIIVSTWQLTLLALAVYIAGTEIRVRAEDRLLRARFGSSAIAYQSRVKAYIPFVR